MKTKKNKDLMLRVRMTLAEKKQLKKLAKLFKMTNSATVRHLITEKLNYIKKLKLSR
jgi:hypothetical protein